MNFLITGGAGNLGSALAKRFLNDKNNSVVVTDKFLTGSSNNLPKNEPRFNFIAADSNSFSEMSSIFQKNSFDYVFHYAAVVGGCASGSTALGAKLANTPPVATVSGALVQLMGDPLKAVLAFDKAFPPDVQRVAYVDPRKDIIDQVISVAAGTKDHLNSVRISRAPGGRLVDASDIHLVRQRLDEIDANHVQIVLSGRLSPERIMDLVENNAPVDILHDTSYIASSSPVPFSPNIRSISDKEVPQELDPMPPNPRLLRLL